MLWAYHALLRLYPADYRAAFAAAMWVTLQKAAADAHGCGCVAILRLTLAELAGLLAGAATEWVAKLTTDQSVRGRSLPDLRMMRPAGVTRESWFRGA